MLDALPGRIYALDEPRPFGPGLGGCDGGLIPSRPKRKPPHFRVQHREHEREGMGSGGMA
jgi:hypothetical protein